MSIASMTLTEQGHLFGVWTGVGREWCLGCRCRTDSPRASAPCPEGDEMAADIEAQRWADELYRAGLPWSWPPSETPSV